MTNGKKNETNTLEEMWVASERRDKERRRRENRTLWYEFHMRLSEAHAQISEEHEAQALRLLEDERDGAQAAHDRYKSGTREARKRPAAAGEEETVPKTLGQGGTTT